MAETPSAGPEISDEQRQRMLYKKALRRKRRKEREAEGEIKELNITAMMDMMTIILVFLLKSYSASALSTASQDLALPLSSTRLTPKETITVTVTDKAIMVGEKNIVEVRNSKVPADLKQGGEDSYYIVPLADALTKEVDKLKSIAQYNPNVHFNGELSIVGDKKIPYRLLTEVLYTAGQCSLDSYRFVVMQKEGGGSGAAARDEEDR